MEEKIDLRADGTIKASFDEKEYVLRRPKIGEFRKLQEQLTAMSDLQREWAQTRVEAEKNGSAVPTFDPVKEVIAWFRSAFDLLGDNSLPEAEDDLPTWFLNASLMTVFLRHWRDVPLARGGQAVDLGQEMQTQLSEALSAASA